MRQDQFFSTAFFALIKFDGKARISSGRFIPFSAKTSRPFLGAKHSYITQTLVKEAFSKAVRKLLSLLLNNNKKKLSRR